MLRRDKIKSYIKIDRQAGGKKTTTIQIMVMVFNATFNNISVISWCLVLLVYLVCYSIRVLSLISHSVVWLIEWFKYYFLRWIYTPGATAMRRAMKLLRWRSDTIAKSLLFCRVATIVFSSCCLVILITFFFMISDGNYSAMVAISLKS